MENIINIGTFVQQLTYYIKTAIYINKGTDKEAILEKCIKMYNKFKTIEASEEINGDDESVVRRCLKRLNLILKIDNKGNPVDIKNKENQTRMVYLKAHPAIVNDNINSMIKFATKHNIMIFTDIPFMFVLRDSKYQELLWQYTRSLFYISQLLISKVDRDRVDYVDKNIQQKKIIFDDASEKLEIILTKIAEIDESIKLNEMMAVDKFLNNKLVKTGINDKNVNDARNEVKEIFNKKGLGKDNSMTKMVDLISDKLTGIDLSGGNIIQSMFGIAQDVAQDLRGDLEGDPDKFQSTIGAITEVFKEAMDSSAAQGEAIPDNLKNIFNSVLAAGPLGTGEGMATEDISKHLEEIITTNGLNRDEFYNTIQGNNGDIDATKLESYLSKLA